VADLLSADGISQRFGSRIGSTVYRWAIAQPGRRLKLREVLRA
jgi:hypothetical protein